jgi:hypothetical protein
MREQSTSEAMVGGSMSFSDIQDAVTAAIHERLGTEMGGTYRYVTDLTDSDVVYACGADDLYQCTYEIDDAGQVTLGNPSPVVRTYAPSPAAVVAEEAAETPEEEVTEDAAEMTESRDRISGRVMEAKGSSESGSRIFRVRLIAYGDSKNGRRYPESVMSSAVPIYEGARAYDHHRTEAELRSSTIAGLIGTYRSVEAETDGLYADLHLLPSATHAAEALDASLAAQDAGLTPLVGVSHDVMAKYKPIVAGGRRMQEATAIVKVNSADLVADPAAGGKATRMVAAMDGTGTVPAETQEDDVPPTVEDVLGALAEATDEQLAGAGLARAVEAEEEEVEQVTEATEPTSAKTGWMAQAMIAAKVKAAGLPEAVVESLTTELPDRITESDVDGRISSLKSMAGVFERSGLVPDVGRVQVTQEAHDKKVERLDAMFAGDYGKGYRSFREAWADYTGHRPRAWDEDLNRTIMQESIGGGHYHSEVKRSEESMNTSSWDVILGDSVTRRMVADYSHPALSSWRKIVSSIVPIADFRTQRLERLGGYGTLPLVNQGQPYGPLTSPGDEEATYSIAKRGGTEDLTLEMIANDDLRAIAKIPQKLGKAAAQTLFHYVWDILPTNAATTYDATALFHANHANTTAGALSQSQLTALRIKMLQQAAYGDSVDILSLAPKFLVVPTALEELAFQLATSAVAIPATPAGPSDTPNLHQGIEVIRLDYYSDANDFFLVADPSMCPTIEMGFYQGREVPELFTQSDPSVGSMFNSDTLTFKIRHVYNGVVVDHRGFQRATN